MRLLISQEEILWIFRSVNMISIVFLVLIVKNSVLSNTNKNYNKKYVVKNTLFVVQSI